VQFLTWSGLFNGEFYGALCSVDLLATVEDEVEETGKEMVYLDVLFQRFPEWVRHSTKETSEYVFGPRF
jgi:hypothetical protein